MRSAIGIVLPLLLWTLPSPAGPPVPERPTDGAARVAASVDVTLFNVDVVVTDAKGNVVHGLTADDFEVRHDGKPVRPTNFHEVRADTEPPAASPVAPPAPGRDVAPAPAPTAAPRPPRRVVLFFDRLQIPDPIERKNLFDSVRGLLEKTLAEGDEAMIVTWNRSIRTVLPFTDDPERLEESLAAVEKAANRIPGEKAELDALASENAWFSSLAADPKIATDFGGSLLSAENAAQQALFEMKAKTAALKGIAVTLGGMEGRKALVFVSHRFSRYAGLEFLIQSTGPSSTADPSKVLERDGRAMEFDTKRLLDEVTRAANAGGVTLYALLPTSLDAILPSAADSQMGQAMRENAQVTFDNEMQALSYVAEKTGGLAAAGRLSASSFLDRVSSDLDSWYSLGYPSRSDTTRVAPVSVRMRDRRLTARVRTAVVEKSVEEQMKDRVLAQLFRPDAQARIPITVTSAATPDSGGKIRTRLEIQIPIGSLVLLPTAKGVSGAFSVLVAAVSPDGAFSEITRRSQPFEIAAKDLETATAGHYTYELEIVTSGPEARVSVGVWDEKGNDAGFAVVSATGSPAPTPLPSPG